MKNAHTLRVELPHTPYDIVVGERLLPHAGTLISHVWKGDMALVVTDEHVAKLYLHRLTGALEEAGIRSKLFIVPAGEGAKSLTSMNQLVEQMVQARASRDSMVIALGGGVVGDLAGFAASILLRGVPFVQIPTTLLAQVDSSVGGKTAVNSAYGKNLIGSFHQPKLVIADVQTLTSLPARELKAGYAEIVKYGFIRDAEFFAWLEANGAQVLAAQPSALAEAVVRSCRNKAEIVVADEREQNIRALLNFGHTFAHAFEAETGYSDVLLHGEAVSIGMALAWKLSARMGLCAEATAARATDHMRTLDLPVSPRAIRPTWDVEALLEHFTRDKKARSGQLTFILARDIGDAFVCREVGEELLRALLTEECHPNEARHVG